MRQIGTLPKDLDPKAFADHLLSLGMKTRIDDRPEGWQVWIYNEDHIQQARDELEGYLRQPDDPRYRSAAQTAEAIRREREAAREEVPEELSRCLATSGAIPASGSVP